MLAAYYGLGTDSGQFEHLAIAKGESYREHLNQYNVIFLNVQQFLSQTENIATLKELIEKTLLWELLDEYSNLNYFNTSSLTSVLQTISSKMSTDFIFIIDEWDCIFREYKNDTESQRLYLDFIRNLLKDQPYVALAYMTGILPIKKYGTHSALNMFDEFSMTNPGPLAPFVGFTDQEVQNLCAEFQMDYEEIKRMYDGYTLLVHLGYLGYDYKTKEIFIPNSEIASEFCNAVESAGWDNITAKGFSKSLLYR